MIFFYSRSRSLCVGIRTFFFRSPLHLIACCNRLESFAKCAKDFLIEFEFLRWKPLKLLPNEMDIFTFKEHLASNRKRCTQREINSHYIDDFVSLQIFFIFFFKNQWKYVWQIFRNAFRCISSGIRIDLFRKSLCTSNVKKFHWKQKKKNHWIELALFLVLAGSNPGQLNLKLKG